MRVIKGEKYFLANEKQAIEKLSTV